MNESIENSGQSDYLAFYVLGRTDMSSMTGGMFAAHAAHAMRQADHLIASEAAFGQNWVEAYEAWCCQTEQKFGVTLSLDAGTIEHVRSLVANAKAAGLPAAVVHDPTYPVVDGATVHLVPVDTCGWIFARKEEAAFLLDKLKLYP